jgi:hypothetical protein
MEIKEPMYLVTVKYDGRLSSRQYRTIRDAGIIWDSGWATVEIDNMVLMPDLSVRLITKEENFKIQEIADEYSASK